MEKIGVTKSKKCYVFTAQIIVVEQFKFKNNYTEKYLFQRTILQLTKNISDFFI